MAASVRQILVNVGHAAVIEEFIPEEEKKPIPHDEISEKLALSDAIFLFLTDNVLATEYTRNWVIFEVGLARQSLKRVFVFERQGTPIPYPIPYVTDYMLFDPESIHDMLAIQTMAKVLIGRVPVGWVGAGIGALLGAAFDPLGVGIGAIVGGLIGHDKDVQMESEIPTMDCPNDSCRLHFRYYSPNITQFSCPACRRPMTL